MTKRLIIDLALCDQCDSCAVGCGGLLSLREKATFELVCRRCAQASCIIACPFGALERLDDGAVIKRHNLRCVSCKLCAQACPFGTIYPELLPFYSLSYENSCVACLDSNRGHSAGNGASAVLPQAKKRLRNTVARALPHDEPPCVAACPEGALEYREIDPAEDQVHVIDEHLAARAKRWLRLDNTGGTAT
ncbi:unnamed protein product [marine sediment metagenome]|uniref:4Fe-4S ferredoxin-type domain-containing protein n=1 Tax=marine sediment metagenome TaxID=412755 RepID=X1BM40_9ZZZZ